MATESTASTRAEGNAAWKPGDYVETRLFIDGKFVDASDKGTFTLKSPTTLADVAEVAEATTSDTNDAVASALRAQPSWSALTPTERGTYMKKLASLISKSHSELAYLDAISMGRPVSVYNDSFLAASRFNHYAEAGYSPQGTTSLHTPGFVNMTFKQPHGVVAAIIPWNAPLIFFAGKVAPAIAAGNCVVLKSSEKAPLTSAKLATLIEQAGFPPGVINVLSGHGQVSGACLSSHMDVRAISFTGSGRTGRLIQEAAAKSNLKRVILELGGKSPSVVFEDADIDAAVYATQFSISLNAGQICMANSRLYVQDSIAEKFIKKFTDMFGAVRIGDPTTNETFMGPVADRVQFDTVSKYIESGKEAGGNVILSGKGRNDGDGYFVSPTVFTETPESAKIMKEEVFGPVVNISTFKSEEEALRKANDTEYGLYAAVFTKDIDRALRFAKGMEAGTVGINCTSPTIAADMPFGGFKSSGLGREGMFESMDNFLETKTVLIKIA